MYWREVSTPSELEEYIAFEQLTFSVEDWSRFEDYDVWMEEKGLRIFMLTTETGYLPNRNPVIVGSFNVFVEDNVAYMGGFAIGKAQRGFKIKSKIN
ncbi:MAG: hypothetical protein HC836_48690 [Richelia sp. RM2_1_2]|nr:hypothetical protein [Richelia sp. RM2_1_2]